MKINTLMEWGGLKNFIRAKFHKATKRMVRWMDPYVRFSYAQEGEDLVLMRIFEGNRDGFYVDVGAHHPQRFSNTYCFHLQGWVGINIDANPDAIELFERYRKSDINVQVGVSDQPGVLTYHFFDDPALNSFDAELVGWRLRNTPYQVVRTCEIPVERLETILSKHLPEGKKIDFLSIDVEGLDYAVLTSNDWDKFRPKCVLVESLASSVEGVFEGDLYQFMKKQGYEFYAKTVNTLFFLDKNRYV